MKHIKKYFLIAQTSLQNNLAYASGFIFSSMFYVFIIFIFLMLWKTIYGSGNTIAGYTLTQMIWYCIITEMVVLSKSKSFKSMNEDIKSGGIAYQLNKPYHYILYLFSNNFGEMGIKLIINLTAGIGMGLLYVGPIANFNLGYLPFMITSFLLAIIMNFFMLTIIGLASFWFEDNEAFYWIYSKLTMMLGMMLPIEFFPQWLKSIIQFLPFPYITYGPAKLVVDFSVDKYITIAAVQILYLVIFVFLAFLVYSRGVKKLNVNGG